MARKLDRILVVDVEATCWEGEPPPGQTSEIVEIGLCVLDVATLARVERVDILVRPVSSTVGSYCTHLTTLTQAEVEGGVPLAEACRVLASDYQARERPWASFGDYDRRQFEQNCGQFGIPYPFGPTHINVKSWLAVARAWPREVGMSEALKREGLPLEGTHHRGVDDAWNIAAILGHLLRASRMQHAGSASGA